MGLGPASSLCRTGGPAFHNSSAGFRFQSSRGVADYSAPGLPIDALLAITRPISLRFPVGLALYLANNGFLIPHVMLERIHDQHSEFISVFALDYGRISADKFCNIHDCAPEKWAGACMVSQASVAEKCLTARSAYINLLV
jgi:hypothetical protein